METKEPTKLFLTSEEKENMLFRREALQMVNYQEFLVKSDFDNFIKNVICPRLAVNPAESEVKLSKDCDYLEVSPRIIVPGKEENGKDIKNG